MDIQQKGNIFILRLHKTELFLISIVKSYNYNPYVLYVYLTVYFFIGDIMTDIGKTPVSYNTYLATYKKLQQAIQAVNELNTVPDGYDENTWAKWKEWAKSPIPTLDAFQQNQVTCEANHEVFLETLSDVTKSLPPQIMQLIFKLVELVSTEQTYHDDLDLFITKYLQPLEIDEELKKDPDVQILISKLIQLRPILELSKNILGELKAAQETKQHDPYKTTLAAQAAAVSEVFTKYEVQIRQNYSAYANTFEEITAIENKLMLQNPKYVKFSTSFKDSQDKGNGKTAAAFYITTIQRIPRYQLLLSEAKKLLSENQDAKEATTLVTEALKSITEVCSDINSTKASFDYSSKFLHSDGFQIKVKNIQYDEAATASAIKQNSGNRYTTKTEKRVSAEDKKKLTIYDKHKRTILRIKYRTDETGDHMDLLCGKKEIQQFADDNIHYKATEVIKKLPHHQKIDAALIEQVQSQLQQEEFFPGCTFKITSRNSDKTKLKIKVLDAKGVEILDLREGKDNTYTIEKAVDPNKQFFNPIELHEEAVKATVIAINATKSKDESHPCVCKVRSKDPQYIQDLAGTLISKGVRGIDVKKYSQEITTRKIKLTSKEISILSDETGTKESEKLALLNRYQEILFTGYIPFIEGGEAQKLFSAYSNAKPQSFFITTHNPLLAIQQYTVMMDHNVIIALSPEVQQVICKRVMNTTPPTTVKMRDTSDQSKNLEKLQLAISLGFIPTDMDSSNSTFLNTLNTASLKNHANIPISITASEPEIAKAQWKALISAGIPAKFAPEANAAKRKILTDKTAFNLPIKIPYHTTKVDDDLITDVEKELLKDFPITEFKIEVTARKSDDTKLKIKVSGTNGEEILDLREEENNEYTIVTAKDPNRQWAHSIEINTEHPENAVLAYQAALDAGFNPTFSEETRTKVLENKEAMPSITITNPTNPELATKQYQKLMTDNLKVELEDATAAAVRSHLIKHKQLTPVTMHTSGNPSGDLLKLETAICLGFVPDLTSEFLSSIHGLELANTDITITATSPAIAAAQWKTLISAGIPAKFVDENIRKAALQVITKPDINIAVDTIAINQAAAPQQDLRAKNAVAAYQAALNAGFNSSFTVPTKSLILEAQYNLTNMPRINIAKPNLEIFKRTLENGLLLDNDSLQRLIANPNKSQSEMNITFRGIKDLNSMPLLLAQIKQIEEINAKTDNKIKYSSDDTTAKTIQPAWDNITKYRLREFSDTYHSFLLSQYKTTITGSNWLSKIMPEWLKLRRTKDKQTENGVNISSKRRSQIKGLQEMLTNNIGDSVPAHRITYMIKELNKLIINIRDENNLFDSRLLKICIQMKHELEVIQEMNNAAYPRSFVEQELTTLHRNFSADPKGAVTKEKLTRPLTPEQQEKLDVLHDIQRKKFLENLIETKGHLPANLLKELIKLLKEYPEPAKDKEFLENLLDAKVPLPEELLHELVTLLIHSTEPLNNYELKDLLDPNQRRERLNYLIDIQATQKLEPTALSLLKKEQMLIENDPHYEAAPKKPFDPTTGTRV